MLLYCLVMLYKIYAELFDKLNSNFRVCWEKFGWGSKKADEVLLPVLKEYDKHETQLRLEAFYTFNEKFAKIRSKRIKSALKGVRGNKSEDVMNDSGEGDSKNRKRRKANYVEAKTNEVEKDSGLPDHGVIKQKIPKILKPKQSRGRNSQGEAVEGIDTQPSEEASMTSARNGSNDRRGMGRRILSSGKRKKNKINSCLEDVGTSSDGEFNNETEERAPREFERPSKVRRSERPRKAVNYTISNEDILEECCATTSKLDGFETSHNKVIGNSLSGKPPNEENNPENLQQESPEDFLESGGGFCSEVTEPSQANLGDIGNAVVEDQLSEGYLKMGGGFCLEDDAARGNTDEYPGKAAESSQVNSRSDGDPLAEDHISEEYLKIGGGFCLDDDEAADGNRDNRPSVTKPNSSATTEEEIMLSHPSQSISSHVSPDNDLCKGKTNVAVDSSSNDIGDKEKNGLSENQTPLHAMPNLRRKRRQT
ncbi:hypothetical protein Leryth_019946 [Lithospermum erythrorhizon]|nr:hypothetical protein Leryth_019946 [Lithospermum erythrorhizon]